MGYARPYPSPYRESTSVVPLGDIWDCAINGRPFRLDRSSDAFNQGMQSMPATREQADNSNEPGEQSISRNDLWRASQSSWHKGAGQRYRDKAESDPERFWASRGIDVWTLDQISLLPGVTQPIDSTGHTPWLKQSGNYLYLANGTIVQRSTDGLTWSQLGYQGQPSTQITSMATNGYTVWFTTSQATYKLSGSETQLQSWLAQPAVGQYERVAFVNNRLLVTNGRYICEVRGDGVAHQLNPAEGNSDWRWTAIAEGDNCIYAAGVSGGRSQIFSIAPPDDNPSGDLGVPIPAAPALPSGELVKTMVSSLGILVMGTERGIRAAKQGTGRSIISRSITIGPVIRASGPVYALEAVGTFVYFGWSRFDDTHCGVGRLNLAQQTDTDVYAYASDLMANITPGAVVSIASFGQRIYFGVENKGVFRQSDEKVASGYLDSSYIRYGVIDPKVAERFEINASGKGTVSAELSADDGLYTQLGNKQIDGDTIINFSGLELNGSFYRARVTLAPSGTTVSPVVAHTSLRAAVIPVRGDSFLVPLMLDEKDSKYQSRHPSDDFEYLVDLASQRRSVTYQEKQKVFTVIILDYQFQRIKETKDRRWWNGVMVIKLMAPANP